MLSASILLVILFGINVINCSPIHQPKICNIASYNDSNEFDLELLDGNWYDVTRTKFIYNDNTWKNGHSSIVVDKSMKQIELISSGIDNKNKCQFSEKIQANYSNDTGVFFQLENRIGSLKILNYTSEILVLAICFNGSDFNKFCDVDQLELFVWSRSRVNVSDDYSQRAYKSLLNEFCNLNDDDLLFSDVDLNVCINKTDNQDEGSGDQLIAIAEFISMQNITNLYNRTNDIEINIDLTSINETSLMEKNTIFDLTNSTLILKLNNTLNDSKTENNSTNNQTTLTEKPNLLNLTFVPITDETNSSNDEDSIVESDDKDIMIIGLKKNSYDSKFDPIYIEIESGSGDAESKVSLSEIESSSANEIGLKKQISKINTNELSTQDEQTDLDVTEGESVNHESTQEMKTGEDDLEIVENDKDIKTADYEIKAEQTTSDSIILNSTQFIDLIEDESTINLDQTTEINDVSNEKVEDLVKEAESSEDSSSEKDSEEQEINNSLEKEPTSTIKSENQFIDEPIRDNELIVKEYTTQPIITEEDEETTELLTTIGITTTSYPCPDYQCHVTVCNHGHKKDENNCNTCDCLKNPDNSTDECSPPYCHPCFYGSYTDINGCDSCACKPRPKPKSVYECPKLDCVSCNYGSIKDEYGCETCICIRPNSLEPSYQCSAIPVCPYGACKHGSVLNDFGCPTCDCLKSIKPDRGECVRERCQPCQHGYFTDSEGCETCSCKPEWMAPCGQSEITCDLSKCKHGTYLDRNGCPSCECLPDPTTSSMSCQEMQETNGQTECNNDGTFKSKQCNDQECRCVTKDGIPISDFKAQLHEAQHMNCECALALYDVSVFKAVGFKLYCASNGNYETIQCVGSSCACVNEHGDPLGPSVPIYQKHLLRCEGVFQRVYYDQYLTTIAPTTLTPPLCVYHRERAEEMSNMDTHMSIPLCDEKGLYEPLQCDRQKKYCWCVNVHNGVELNGSRKTGQEPDCSLLSG